MGRLLEERGGRLSMPGRVRDREHNAQGKKRRTNAPEHRCLRSMLGLLENEAEAVLPGPARNCKNSSLAGSLAVRNLPLVQCYVSMRSLVWIYPTELASFVPTLFYNQRNTYAPR